MKYLSRPHFSYGLYPNTIISYTKYTLETNLTWVKYLHNNIKFLRSGYSIHQKRFLAESSELVHVPKSRDARKAAYDDDSRNPSLKRTIEVGV